MNLCILGSSGGYAIDYLIYAIKLGLVKCKINRIITDRDCRTNSIAIKHGIDLISVNQSLENTSREDYSNLLLDNIPEDTDLIVISLKRLISGEILKKYKNKIINTHPSLLPSYPGYGANAKLLSEGKAMFGGCSCHLVNENIDDGPMLIQSVVPLNFKDDQKKWEFKLWNYQKYNLCQAVQFFSEKRIKIIDNKVFIKNANYNSLPTNPKLEIDFSKVDKIFKLE